MSASETLREDLPEYDVAPLVYGAAYRVHRRWRDWVEREDLQQEIWAWVYSHVDRIVALVAEHGDNQDHIDNRLTLWFTGAAESHARREKARQVGYDTSDEYFYDVKIIERLLPYVWAVPTDTAMSDTRVRTGSDPAEGGNLMAMVADVSAAVDQLDAPTYATLLTYYGQSSRDETDVADAMGVTVVALRKRRDRALKHVRRLLGGRRPYLAA